MVLFAAAMAAVLAFRSTGRASTQEFATAVLVAVDSAPPLHEIEPQTQYSVIGLAEPTPEIAPHIQRLAAENVAAPFAI